jgi:hypothetical protein
MDLAPRHQIMLLLLLLLLKGALILVINALFFNPLKKHIFANIENLLYCNYYILQILQITNFQCFQLTL